MLGEGRRCPQGLQGLGHLARADGRAARGPGAGTGSAGRDSAGSDSARTAARPGDAGSRACRRRCSWLKGAAQGGHHLLLASAQHPRDDLGMELFALDGGHREQLLLLARQAGDVRGDHRLHPLGQAVPIEGRPLGPPAGGVAQQVAALLQPAQELDGEQGVAPRCAGRAPRERRSPGGWARAPPAPRPGPARRPAPGPKRNPPRAPAAREAQPPGDEAGPSVPAATSSGR